MRVFYNEEQIESDLQILLQAKEFIYTEAVTGNVSLYWTAVEDDRGRKLYQLIRRGFRETCIGTFTRDELERLSNQDFRDRVLVRDVERQRSEDRQYIEQRLTDWRHRIETLFATVESWIPQGFFEVHRGSVTQPNEDLMRRYGVTPTEVPTLDLRRNGKRIAFVPSALWIIGADGRVNITTNTKQYCIVDMRQEHEGPSQWRLVVDDIRKGTVPFDQTIFQEIVRRHA